MQWMPRSLWDFKQILLLFYLLFSLFCCKDEKIEPIAINLLSDECELLSYEFDKGLNDVLSKTYQAEINKNADTLDFCFLHFTDIGSLTASFEISEKATLLVDTVVQRSDTTANNFYELVNYTVLAENDTNKYEFVVRASYPLLFATVGHSGDNARVGSGDFVKDTLYKVSNLPDGLWNYQIYIEGFSYSTMIEVKNNSFQIPNFISETEWLNLNNGEDCSLPVTLVLSSEELGITDSTFEFTINREQYVIRSWQDLQQMRYNLSGSYTMEKDVAFPLPGTENFPEEGFIPVGDSLAMPFTGSFDGKNHVISDFFIRRYSDTTRYVGLFGAIERKMDNVPIIKNIGIEIATRDERGGISGGWFSGGVAGWNEGKIINCYVKGSVLSISPDTEPGGSGGLVGCNWGGEIESCSAFGGTVTANVAVGGLVGQNASGATISRSCSGQDVVLTGIPAYLSQTISGGGLVGDNSTESEIVNCYSTGNVTGRENIGGFAGRHSTFSTISLCYSSGKVSETDNNNSVTVGGFAGELYNSENRRAVTDCYWSIAANPGLDGVGEGAITGVDGASDEDFQSESMFLGWDFSTIWKIDASCNNGKACLIDVKGQEN